MKEVVTRSSNLELMARLEKVDAEISAGETGRAGKQYFHARFESITG